MPSTSDKIRKLVGDHVRKDMPDEIKRLAAYARADLHFGPEHNGLDPDAPFPGFESATVTIGTWARDNMPRELWVDVDCEEVLTSEPEGYYDGDEWIAPDTEHIYRMDSRDIKRAVFGSALAEYVW